MYIVVVCLSIYAWKDWFKSLCGLILLTVIAAQPGFPQSFGNIQGLNLLNIVFTNVLLAWLMNRRRQGLFWDMPRNITVFLLLWLGVILIGWVWMIFDTSNLKGFTLIDLISEQLINTIKWPLLGLLLFDGCRTHHQVKVALACILLFFALWTFQIVRVVPPEIVLESGYSKLSDDDFRSDLGISPNGAGKMMSGVPWAMLAVVPLLKIRICRFFMLGLCFIGIYTLALTGSRSAYIACGTTLILLCIMRWRKYLLLLPFAVLILPIALPGASGWMTSGFEATNVAGESETDKNSVTSGRNLIWPMVLAKIYESPVFGFGREAMQRTGLKDELENKYGLIEGVAVNHPHNAYLLILLDSGLIGLIIIVGFHMVIWAYCARLFVDRGDPLCTAVGGLTLALLTGNLVSCMGGQSFYAQEIDVGLWCAIGVMLRLYVERDRLNTDVNGAPAVSTRATEDIRVSQTPLGWINS